MSCFVEIKSSLGLCYIKADDGSFTTERNRAKIFPSAFVALEIAQLGMKRSIDLAFQTCRGEKLLIRGMKVSIINLKPLGEG